MTRLKSAYRITPKITPKIKVKMITTVVGVDDAEVVGEAVVGAEVTCVMQV